MSGAGRQPLHDPCCWYNLGGLAQEGPCVWIATQQQGMDLDSLLPQICVK